MATPLETLRVEWNRLAPAIAWLIPAEEIWATLSRHYTEPHRHYHNARHIEHCLAEFSAVSPLAQRPQAVAIALWFHDVIYDPRAKDNEEQSALLAERFLADPALAQEVRALILATRHVAEPTTPDAALIVDLDLCILGQPRARYEEFEKEIRAEYAWVSPADYAAGRTAVLQGFLRRPHIYTTATLHEKYEAAARENLAWAIAQLR